MTKLIHPKTGTVREVSESNVNKNRLLARAGFIPLDQYRPKKKKVVVPDPTVADVVKSNKLDAADQIGDLDPVIAIHASGSARGLIEKNDLDASLIEGSGKDGQITKPDVLDYLENIAQDGEEEDTLPDTGPEDENPAEAVLEASDDESVEVEAE